VKSIGFKKYRPIWLLAVVVFLPASAAVWVLAHDSLALFIAAALGIFGGTAVLVEEVLMSVSEREIERLESLVDKQSGQLNSLIETIRENDRIIGALEIHNNALGAELISIKSHSEAA